MPGENFSRRVAHAASIGGGRGYKSKTPFGWYAILVAICVLGVALVGYSRYEAGHTTTAATKPAVPPTQANQWEVGLDFDICGRIKQVPASTNLAQAYTSNGKGVLTIEPARASDPLLYSGINANLNSLLISTSAVLSSNLLQLPPKPAPTTTTSSTSSTTKPGSGSSSTTKPGSANTSTTSGTAAKPPAATPKPVVYKNGESCGGKPAVVQVKEWKSPTAKTGSIITASAPSLKLKDGQLLTIAFLPKGAAIPKPVSAKSIEDYLISNPSGIVLTTTSPPASSTATPSSSSTPGSGSTTATSATTATTAASKKHSKK